MIPIYINDEKYVINPSTDYLNEGASGTCYKVRKNDKLLTVKLYRSQPIQNDDEVIFPDENTLEILTQLSTLVDPILLSRFITRDEDGNYTGCARYYIEPTTTDTTKAIFQLPKDVALTHFKKIEEKIPIFDRAGIVVDDWNSYNLMLGKIANGDESLFLFDDSNYFQSSYANNYGEFMHLMEDLVEEYLQSLSMNYKQSSIIKELRNSGSPISFFDNISKDCDTLGESVLAYVKKRG